MDNYADPVPLEPGYRDEHDGGAREVEDSVDASMNVGGVNNHPAGNVAFRPFTMEDFLNEGGAVGAADDLSQVFTEQELDAMMNPVANNSQDGRADGAGEFGDPLDALVNPSIDIYSGPNHSSGAGPEKDLLSNALMNPGLADHPGPDHSFPPQLQDLAQINNAWPPMVMPSKAQPHVGAPGAGDFTNSFDAFTNPFPANQFTVDYTFGLGAVQDLVRQGLDFASLDQIFPLPDLNFAPPLQLFAHPVQGPHPDQNLAHTNQNLYPAHPVENLNPAHPVQDPAQYDPLLNNLTNAGTADCNMADYPMADPPMADYPEASSSLQTHQEQEFAQYDPLLLSSASAGEAAVANTASGAEGVQHAQSEGKDDDDDAESGANSPTSVAAKKKPRKRAGKKNKKKGASGSGQSTAAPALTFPELCTAYRDSFSNPKATNADHMRHAHPFVVALLTHCKLCPYPPTPLPQSPLAPANKITQATLPPKASPLPPPPSPLSPTTAGPCSATPKKSKPPRATPAPAKSSSALRPTSTVPR
jgi:hypothetical protein